MKINLSLKRILIFLLLITLVVSLSGCSGNRKEIQKLSLVVAFGVDLLGNDKYEITMQVLNPTSSSGGPEGGGEGKSSSETLVFSGIGDTFYDAIYDASKTMGKIQHFGHTKYIVVGDSLAKKGVSNLVDSLSRLNEVRLNTPLFITKGAASDIVKAQTPENRIPANTVENLFLRQELIGFRPFTYLIDFIESLGSKTTSPVAAVIELAKSKSGTSAETFNLSGTAVFKEDKLIGYLNSKETRGLRWIGGNVQVGSITFTCPDYSKTSVEILTSSSKIKPIVNNDKISYQIDIKVETALRETSKKIDPSKNPEILDIMGSCLNKAVQNEVELALLASKDTLGADIIGLGEVLHKSNPKLWNAISNNWDMLYPNLEVNINVNSSINGTGLTGKSVK